MRVQSMLHTSQEFLAAYGDGSSEFYRSLLADVLEFSPPRLELEVGATTGLFVECCARFAITGNVVLRRPRHG